MITLYPAGPRVDGGALVIYTGTPARAVDWQLTGSGSLVAITNFTDHNGQAAARYTSGTLGDSITITVTSGA